MNDKMTDFVKTARKAAGPSGFHDCAGAGLTLVRPTGKIMFPAFGI